jgi:hypothetical protein
MYNDPSAKDLLAMYPRQLAEGGAVDQPFQAPAVAPRGAPLPAASANPSLAVAPRQRPVLAPVTPTLSMSQQFARDRAAQDAIIKDAIRSTGVTNPSTMDYRTLQQAVRAGDITGENIKQKFVDPELEARVRNAYAAIGRTGGVVPTLEMPKKGGPTADTYKNVTQGEYDYWANQLKQGKISPADFQNAFLTKASTAPATDLEAQRAYVNSARKALGLPDLEVPKKKSTGAVVGMGGTGTQSPVRGPAQYVGIGGTGTQSPGSGPAQYIKPKAPKTPKTPTQPVDLSGSGSTPVQLFDEGGEAVADQNPRSMDLEQFLLDNSRTQLGPVDVQEVRSSRGPGKYDTRISKDMEGFQAFADVDVGDKKLSQVGARFMGRGRIGNYEVQYVFDPETKQPVITGAIRKELSPTSDVSAEGVYVPQKDGKDYYNAGVRYTKRFEDGGEVTNENVRTLRSIDVTPTNKKEVGHPNEYVDAVARWGRKGQEGFANMIGLGEEVKFANAIPEFYFPKDEQLDGRGDAMRHMLLQAQIAKKLGRTPAEIASWIHETMLTGGQSDAEKAMDVSNDARGMDIGLRSKDKADMAYQALQAIKSGEAKTIAKAKKPKKFEDGGEVRTLKSIDVTPEDKPEKSRVKENLDAIMQGLKNEDISAKDVALFINSFIPVSGDIQSAAEGYQAFKDKDYLGAGLGAAGALPLVPNTTKFVRGSISDLINKVKNERGEYMGRRAERAADEVPNLENQYSEKALENTLMDRSNPQALMVLDPKDFEEYAMPIAPGLTGSAGEYRGFKVPEGMTYDQYIDYLAKAARKSGFTDVPFLNLSGTTAGGVRISGHEGRHRTRALAKLGDKSTLVRLQPDYNLTSTDARRYKDDYIEALKARLGLDPTVAPEAFPDVQIPMPEPFKHGGQVSKFIKSKK